MKKLLVIPLALIVLISCNQQATETNAERELQDQITFPEKAKNMNIYEVNVRQYTPEGTFNAFAEHLPRIKEMGIDIVCLCPFIPLESRKEKKG